MIEEFKPFSVDRAINQQPLKKLLTWERKQGDMKARKPLLAMSIGHWSMTLKNNWGGSKSQSTKTSRSGR
jgi:hypothetical protein